VVLGGELSAVGGESHWERFRRSGSMACIDFGLVMEHISWESDM
jgi:hypothetical protein